MIVIDNTPMDLPNTLATMICGSPDLELLSLEISEDSNAYIKRRPRLDGMFESLKHVRFPRLRSLRAVSWFLSVANESQCVHFQAFMRNHPRLHTIVLGEYITRVTMPPVLELMPSVRQFQGPCFVVQAILDSTLAAQIEDLTLLIDNYALSLAPASDMLPKASSLLPHLHNFCLRPQRQGWYNALVLLKDLLKYMPQLRTLRIDKPRASHTSTWGQPLPNISDGITVLAKFPHLRALALPVGSVIPQDMLRFFESAASVCPRLETLDLYGDQGWAARLDLRRQENGAVTIAGTYRPKYFSPPPEMTGFRPCGHHVWPWSFIRDCSHSDFI